METTKHIFTYNEKKCLRDIVKKYYAIVENKDIHTEAVRQKNATWQQIGEEYNACPHVSFHATPKQLRRLWLNLKQRSKAKPQTLILKKEPELNGTQNEDPLRVELLQKGINELQTFNYRDQQEECRKSEKHEIEMHILKERLREAKAKADLAELIYNQQFNTGAVTAEIEQTNYK
ncbi:uncharacterized protein LOC110995352 [Pieris rapae]|uniref:uncharacterized protein LOC110995352 n=1 Tax=Pieris rapae TaxID=64459 RepID=UPI000B929EC6|nr:uncharacterized protein LOC110995352 [Pieris rapae]